MSKTKRPKRAVDQLFEGHGGATAESLRVAKDETRRRSREEFVARLAAAKPADPGRAAR